MNLVSQNYFPKCYFIIAFIIEFLVHKVCHYSMKSHVLIISLCWNNITIVETWTKQNGKCCNLVESSPRRNVVAGNGWWLFICSQIFVERHTAFRLETKRNQSMYMIRNKHQITHRTEVHTDVAFSNGESKVNYKINRNSIISPKLLIHE